MLKGFFVFVCSVFIILFFALYISQYTGYYDYSSGKKNILTDAAIEKFEADIRAGKSVDTKDYLVEEKNYSNKISRLGMKTSSIIESVFKKGINVIFRELNDVVSD